MFEDELPDQKPVSPALHRRRCLVACVTSAMDVIPSTIADLVANAKENGFLERVGELVVEGGV